MLSARWYKVIRDLWMNKTRTILVMLSIAIGVFALGAILTSREVLSRDLTESYAATTPASATIITEDAFDDDMVEAVRRMRDIAEAEGRRNATMRVQVGEDEWRNISVFAIPDYKDMRLSKVTSESGAWPPPEHEILIERSALGLAGVEQGDTMTIKTPKNKIRELRVAGVTHDLSQSPAVFDGNIYGYVTFDTLEWLGEPRDYNEMHFVVAADADDREHITEVAKLVSRKIEKSGRTVFYTSVPEPGESPMNDVIQTMLLLLGVLGILSLALSAFLVVNTISAILAQQVRQIGIMKAIGARRGQITGLYMTMAVAFGLLSLLLAIPLGMLGAWLFCGFMAGMFNFDLVHFGVPLYVIGIQFVIGLLVPVLAALYPVLKGTHVTAREAMSDYGLGQAQFGRSFIDRTLEHVRGLSRPVLLSLRNTFRQKGRLALTMLTLTLGGAIFISVFSIQASLMQTLDDLLSVWNYDIWLITERPYRMMELQEEALAIPGITEATGTAFATARLVRPDDTESENVFVFGAPAGSDVLKPLISEGRYLVPEDENAIVLTSAFLKNEPDIKVGDEIVLKINGKESTWQMVGTSQWLAPFGYVNYDYLGRLAGDVGRVSSLCMVTDGHDFESQTKAAQALERRFTEAGFNVNAIIKIAKERAEAEATFNIIVTLLLIMAVLMAVVGGLGLMGTMSINVLERTREIGVMRAIGASDGAVVQVFMIEGVLIGLLSWSIGAALALPLSKLLSDAVGLAFWQAPLSYTFSPPGAVVWFVVVVVIAAVSSFLPARGASRVTVREVLAYE